MNQKLDAEKTTAYLMKSTFFEADPAVADLKTTKVAKKSTAIHLRVERDNSVEK